MARFVAPTMVGAALVVPLTAIVALGGAAWLEGNSERGHDVFVRQCALCHTIGKGEPSGFGPNLFGITQRKAGTAPGYKYSPAFRAMANWTWSPDGVASFVAAPALTIPGNRMGVFQGVSDRDLDDLVTYLDTQR
jgi:cytochrome c